MDILLLSMWGFNGARDNFDGLLNLAFWQLLHFRVQSLFNQLFKGFLMDVSQTL